MKCSFNSLTYNCLIRLSVISLSTRAKNHINMIYKFNTYLVHFYIVDIYHCSMVLIRRTFKNVLAATDHFFMRTFFSAKFILHNVRNDFLSI